MTIFVTTPRLVFPQFHFFVIVSVNWRVENMDGTCNAPTGQNRTVGSASSQPRLLIGCSIHITPYQCIRLQSDSLLPTKTAHQWRESTHQGGICIINCLSFFEAGCEILPTLNIYRKNTVRQRIMEFSLLYPSGIKKNILESWKHGSHKSIAL